MTVTTGGDNIGMFLRSSGMITDSVSFLAEYLPSQRPLLFLNRPDRATFSGTGERIIEAHYSGNGIDDIRDFVQQVRIGNDPKAAVRTKVVAQELNISGKTATQEILSYIVEELGLGEI